MHKLLARQLKRIIGDGRLPEACAPLLEAVSRAYEQADADRHLIERSLELASQELLQRNRALKQELEQRRSSARELEEKVRELELLNRVMLDREDRILELKERVQALEANGRTTA